VGTKLQRTGTSPTSRRSVPSIAHEIRDLTNEEDAEKLRTDKDFAANSKLRNLRAWRSRSRHAACTRDTLRAPAGSLEFRVMGIGPETEKNKHAPIFKICASTPAGEAPIMISGDHKILGKLKRDDIIK
jgi:hypothetical protein